ncbi:hypothetical protein BX600DRAFT_230463 [Xylariales sp. PMI_506]|nr:hypothetical protein BX600DRAFT_230463 [Xylariales sp. PMI_506]
MAPAAGHRTASGPASTEEHQVAASNSTLNRFLGGRQPSWMTGAKPVKPTPRPLNQPAKHPRPPELPHPRFSRPRQPAAPSPSFATQNAPRPPQQVSFPQQTHLQRPSPLAAPAQTSTTILAAPTVLPSPDPSDEPSPAVSLSIDSLSPQQSQLFSLGTGDSPAATGLPFAPSRNLDDAVEPTQLAMANGPLAAPESTATPASAMTLQTPPTPSAPNFGPSAVSTPQRSAENTDPSSKRRRIG